MDTVPLALRFSHPGGPTYSHRSEPVEPAGALTRGPSDPHWLPQEDLAEISGGHGIWRGLQALGSSCLKGLGDHPGVHFPAHRWRNGGLRRQGSCLSWD